jgi:1-deoxy-D-xylulose-5-phosphate reductoisomerase
VKKRIAILGSTGSIGTQALEVISRNLDLFEVTVLTGRSNVDLLVQQALKFVPKHVVIANNECFREVNDALSALPIEVHAGEIMLNEIVKIEEIDIVLSALVGFAGVFPTISALKAGKDIALANKETLVVAGENMMELARQLGKNIYPVDSEHSAIFQCLAGEDNAIEKIFLTASGGPFRGMTLEQLKQVTKAEALLHPNWCMGNKVTIDSASLMNKGLEVIEARWLFGVKPSQIEVIVHPQSIIHSIVQFIDGSMKAQMGMPDMRLPIQYALGYPQRLKSDFPRFDFMNYPRLTFELPALNIFRNLSLAYQALERGGNMPCILNAANEVVVEAFLCELMPFLKMPDIIEEVMNKIDFIANPGFDDYAECNLEARKLASSLI